VTRILTAAAFAVAIAGPAAAQVAGTYAGTSADGSPVSFTVSLDNNNELAVTGDSVDFSTNCKGGGNNDGGWGWGTDSVIAKGKAAGNLEFPYATIIWTLKFSTDGQSATGTVSTVVPTLAPVGAKPKKAQICKSAKQAMTLTLQSGDAHAAPAYNGAVVYLGHAGRAAAVTGR
jgi:hypothetical protein